MLSKEMMFSKVSDLLPRESLTDKSYFINEYCKLVFPIEGRTKDKALQKTIMFIVKDGGLLSITIRVETCNVSPQGKPFRKPPRQCLNLRCSGGAE